MAGITSTSASSNQWNLTATGDLNRDGWLDVVVGAMDLENIANLRPRFPGQAMDSRRAPLLFFENRMSAKSQTRVH
jgi:hypothetical protein